MYVIIFFHIYNCIGKYSWEIQRARPIESDPLTRAATTINDTSDVDDKSNSHASNTSNCNGRWHIPIYDKQSWLCIKVNSKTSKI